MSKPKDLNEARTTFPEHLREAGDFHEKSFLIGFDAAVAFLAEPGAMRFMANESITRENAELRKALAESQHDTKLLDFVLDHDGAFDGGAEGETFTYFVGGDIGWESITRLTWREAIGAAMKQMEEGR
jgi:hypothetical protein